MNISSWWKKFRNLLLLTLVIPLAVLALIEGLVRVSGVNTEVIKSDRFQVATPLWVADEANFFSAEALYRDIVHHEVPAVAAEWLTCFEEAPHVRYRMRPGIDRRVVNTVNRRELEQGMKVRMRANSLGFRSADLPRAKPAGTYRIVFLGDSTTFGWGVEADERFSERLAARLNARNDGRNYEVINLGIPGYTSWHGRKAFERFGLPWSPDMVIMSFGANDGKMISQRAKALLQRESALEGVKYFLRRFAAYRLMRRLLLSLTNPFEKLAEQPPAKKQKRVPVVTVAEFRENLTAMVAAARKKGCRAVFLGLCCPADYLAPVSALAERLGVRHLDGMHVLLQSVPQIKAGKINPELYQYYRELYGREALEKRRILTVTSDSCHPNRLGHRVLAAVLEERLF
ncbi:MAG TPA: hypothetical protein ENN40_00030 [Candidatus Aminicenantes bacterium]|nr:hypothetical protein [Candidatus Aminicenantes bacterium]